MLIYIYIASLSHKYYEMWHIEYMSIEKSFAKQDILYVRYEDLKNASRRFYVVKQIVDFLGKLKQAIDDFIFYSSIITN